MFGIITDISRGDGGAIDDLYTRPQSIILSMWKDLQYPNWIDRGQKPEVTAKEKTEDREKALKMWGK